MRTSEFDSSDEEDFGEEEATPLQISWLATYTCAIYSGVSDLFWSTYLKFFLKQHLPHPGVAPRPVT